MQKENLPIFAIFQTISSNKKCKWFSIVSPQPCKTLVERRRQGADSPGETLIHQ